LVSSLNKYFSESGLEDYDQCKGCGKTGVTLLETQWITKLPEILTIKI